MTQRAWVLLSVAVGLLWLHGRRRREDRGAFERRLQEAVEALSVPLTETGLSVLRDARSGANDLFGAQARTGADLLAE